MSRFSVRLELHADRQFMMESKAQVSSVIGVSRYRPDLLEVGGRPVYLVAGQLGIVLIIVLGLGAHPNIRPNAFGAGVLMCVGAFYAFGAKGQLSRLALALPSLAALSWWIASATWSSSLPGWRAQAETFIPVALAMLVLCGTLPIRAVVDAIVAACYIGIAYSVFFTLTNFGLATFDSYGVPGWKAGFGHKNWMALFMVMAILVLLTLERKRGRRTVGCVIAAGFLVMAQSTTALVTGASLLVLAVVLPRLVLSDERWRAFLLFVTASATVVAGWLATLAVPAFLRLSGEDPTLTGRTELWSIVWRQIQAELLVGYGPGLWQNQAVPPASVINAPFAYTTFHAHNGYLEVLLQLGVVGLVLVLVVLGSLVWNGVGVMLIDRGLGLFFVLFAAMTVVSSWAEPTMLGTSQVIFLGLSVLALRARRSAPDDLTNGHAEVPSLSSLSAHCR